jgi:hypothetical protein
METVNSVVNNYQLKLHLSSPVVGVVYKIIKNMKDIFIIIFLIFWGAVVFFLGKYMYETISDRNDWLVSHCQTIGKISGSFGMGPTFSISGKVGFGTMYFPGKIGYQCDDGKTYWK